MNTRKTDIEVQMKIERLRLYNVSFKRPRRKGLLNVWCPTATDVMGASREAAALVTDPRYIEYGISRVWTWRYTFSDGTVRYSDSAPGDLALHGYSNVDGSPV